MKVCSKCKIGKPDEEFGKRKKALDGLQAWCKACNRQNNKDWHKDNPDKYEARRLRFIENNPDYLKNWKSSHPEYMTEWFKTEAGTKWKNQQKLIGQVRRAKIISMVDYDDLPKDYWNLLLKTYGEQCMNPDCKTPGSALSLDHIIPVSKGGVHGMSNFQILCRVCNSTKGNRSDVDYRPRIFVL